MKNIIYISLLICLISCGTDSKKNGNETENESLKLDSNVRYGKLDNGFTYYLRDNNSETTDFRMVVKAGTYHEDKDQLEYAHLMEHVAFKYPNHFPIEENYFNSSGRYKHAHTGNNQTFYYAYIPSEDKEGIQNGVKLLRDWAQDFLLDQTLIDVEREAVLGEMRVNDPHQWWWLNKVDSILVSNTGFTVGNRINHKLNIENFNRDAFLRFHSDWYRPDLEAAIIVGNINVDSLEIKIKEMFSDLKVPEHARMDAQDRMDSQTMRLTGENSFISVLDTVKPDFRVEFFSKRMNRGYVPKIRSDFKQMVLQDLYEKILFTRSQWVLKQYAPPITNFHADLVSTAGDSQLFISGAELDLKNDTADYLQNRFKSATMTWRRLHGGITSPELKTAKRLLVDDYDYGENSSTALAEKYQNHFVSGIPALSPEEEKKMISEILEEISLEDIQKFTLDYGDLSKNMDFIFVSDGDRKIPNEKTLKGWLSDVIQQEVQPLTEPKPAITSLAKTIKLPKKNITVKSVSENVVGVTDITLDNGAKIFLKPVEVSSPMNSNTIEIRAFRTNKAPLKDREEYLLAEIIPEVTAYMGAESYNKFEIDKFKEEKNIRLSFTTNKDYQLIEGSSKVQDLEELLSLIYLYISHPRNDPKALESWKSEKLEEINGNSSRGSSEFYLKDIYDLWYPEIPNLSVNDIKNMSLEEIAEGRKRWFSDFNDFTFIITGDFDKEKLKPVLTNYISKLPFTSSGRSNTPNFNFPLKKMEETIRIKNSNQAYAQLYFPVKVPTDVKSQVELKLVSKALGDRIWERLRNGCYAPRAWGGWLDKGQGIYSFNINFDTELGNEDRMLEMAMEEFNKLRKEGVDQSWLDREIKNEQISFNRQLGSFSLINNFWADQIQQSLKNNTNFEEGILKYETILKNFVSLEDVNEVAKKYLTEENFQKFIVLPLGYEM